MFRWDPFAIERSKEDAARGFKPNYMDRVLANPLFNLGAAIMAGGAQGLPMGIANALNTSRDFDFRRKAAYEDHSNQMEDQFKDLKKTSEFDKLLNRSPLFTPKWIG
ncbi:MAG: hypothetical protein HC923_00205 [Myxococcales bacterium]|nr:hypothetical protein [Myxococcales bacterium]